MPSKPYRTDDDKAKYAAYARAYYKRTKSNPDFGLRADVSAVKTCIRRAVKRIATTKPPLHPADAEVLAATLATLQNDSELLLHPRPPLPPGRSMKTPVTQAEQALHSARPDTMTDFSDRSWWTRVRAWLEAFVCTTCPRTGPSAIVHLNPTIPAATCACGTVYTVELVPRGMVAQERPPTLAEQARRRELVAMTKGRRG